MVPHNIVINPNLAQFGTFERPKIIIYSKWRERKWHKIEVLLYMPYKRRPNSLKHHHRQWPQFEFIDNLYKEYSIIQITNSFLIECDTCHKLYDQLTFSFSLLLNT